MASQARVVVQEGAPSDSSPDLYDPVPHSHVVPSGYLRAWAEGKRIGMRLVGEKQPRVIGLRDAGVRKNAYRRRRPSGEVIYDTEWSMAQAENAAIPVIAMLPDRWPLSMEDRGKVAQFFALQHLRGEAFRSWHQAQMKATLDQVRENPDAGLKPHPGRSAEVVLEELEAVLTGDTYQHLQMLRLVRSVSTILASMHWSLVRFGNGRLATSDHPLVVWPLDQAAGRLPAPNDLSLGVRQSLEIFVAVDPIHLLLMSWRDCRSGAVPLTGHGRHMSTANAFAIANAASQWFHQPETEPWLARGRRAALSPELLRGYNAEEASASARRIRAWELAEEEMARELSNDDLSAVDDVELPEQPVRPVKAFRRARP